MKRVFGHWTRLPGQLGHTVHSTSAAGAAIECPNCGTLARSVDCKANVAGRAGGAGSGGSGAAGSAQGASRQQQQQRCASSSDVTALQRQERLVSASGASLHSGHGAAAGVGAKPSFSNVLMLGGFGGGCVAIGYVSNSWGLSLDSLSLKSLSLGRSFESLAEGLWPEAPVVVGIPGGQVSIGRAHSVPAPLLSPYFIADAAAKVAPAVVNITIRDPQRPMDDAQHGSGFIISAGGKIVTNTHIIADAIPAAGGRSSRTIVCTLQDGRSFQADLLNFDWQSDLAVLEIQAQTQLPVAKLGASSALRVGEWVIALGSPLHLSNSVSAGIVSAVERTGAELGLDGAPTDYIQTDAATAAGSSGGPLVNVQGEVIGISNLKAIAGDGVSFAIPIDTAKDVINQLLAPGGRVARPYIGCKTLELNSSLAAELRANSPSFPDVAEGIYVPYVHPGGPADRAGLQPGDVITGFPGQPLSAKGLTQALAQSMDGKPLPLSVTHADGRRATVRVAATDAMQPRQ